MGDIFLTSDWHFNHPREFVYKVRGFDNVEEMNETIVKKHNNLVAPEDTVYVLGDLCLGGGSDEILRANRKLISNMKGHLKVILGNHDSANRIKMYNECQNVEVIGYADMIKYGGFHFFLSHYPTITTNLDEDKNLKQRVLNLYGHTHQGTNFYNDNPTMYHVGVDSHNCYPVLIETVIKEIKDKVDECVKYL